MGSMPQAIETTDAAIASRSARTASSWLYEVLRFAQRKPLGAAGGVLLMLVLLAAVFAPSIAPHSPTLQDVPDRLQAPNVRFWFGTDSFGRDVFSRIVYGARSSLYVGFASVLVGATAGVVLGGLSGYMGGWLDLLVQRVVDGLLGFPSLVLTIVLVVAL